jgi:hypothetical protein
MLVILVQKMTTPLFGVVVKEHLKVLLLLLWSFHQS